MKLATLYVAVIVFCTSIALLIASPLDDKVAALKKAMDNELALKGDESGKSDRFGNPHAAAASLEQAVTQLDGPGGGNIEAQISQSLTLFSSDEVQKAGQALLAEIQAEQKVRAEKATTDAESLLKRTAIEVNKATKPEDIDDVLLELQKFKDARENGYSPQNQALYQRVSNAFEFTKLWQTYLSHIASKQGQFVYQDLLNLSQSNCLEIVPRSRILAMLAPRKEAAAESNIEKTPDYNRQVWDIVQSVNDLEELEPAIAKLDNLREKDPTAYSEEMIYLEPVFQSYRNVKTGLPANIAADLTAKGDDYLHPLVHRQLLLFFLQHFFSSYRGAAPGTTETPDIYVDRVMTAAAKGQDWTLLKQALTAQNYLHTHTELPSNGTLDAMTALDQLLAGMNQEDGGQYALAVVSYQAALKSLPANLVPPKMIGDRLAGIERDHPKEYAQGIQLVIAPPPSRPFYPGMPGFPAYPGFPTPPVRPTLMIPGNTGSTPTPITNAPPQAPTPPTNSPPVAPPLPASTVQVPPATNAPPVAK